MSELSNKVTLGLHLGAGASDGYLLEAKNVLDGTKTQTVQKTIDSLNTSITNLRNSAATLVERIDVTNCNSNSYFGLSKTVPTKMFICANAAGETSKTDDNGGTAKCTDYLKNLLHPSVNQLDVNLGDVIIAYLDSSGEACARLLPTQDAKAPSDSTYGTYGVMARNDKLNLEQALKDIDQTCFRCYSGTYNMNNCAWYGYYMYCNLGRPAGSVDGENYVLRVANGGKDGDYLVLEQTAYSCLDPARIFRRIVKTKDRSNMTTYNTTWGDWMQVGNVTEDKIKDALGYNPYFYINNQAIDETTTDDGDSEYRVNLALYHDDTVVPLGTTSIGTGYSGTVGIGVHNYTDDDYKSVFDTTLPKLRVKGSQGITVGAYSDNTGPYIDVSGIEATTSEAGMMSAADKKSLDSIATLLSGVDAATIALLKEIKAKVDAGYSVTFSKQYS